MVMLLHFQKFLAEIPQGSVIGPTSFVCFIDDLSDDIILSSLYMFADDTKMVKQIHSLMDCIRIENTSTVFQYTMLQQAVSRKLVQSTDLECNLRVLMDNELTFFDQMHADTNKPNSIRAVINRPVT